MNNNKYEQPLISKHFNFPKDTALRQNNAVQQTPGTNTAKTDNVNEPQNDADAAVKMKIAPEAEKIDALLMLKLFLDRNSGEDFLRIEPNKCMFWYNCDIPDAIGSVNKMPDKEFWNEKISDAQRYITNEGRDKGKLKGEDASRIVAESIGMKTIRMLMDTVDSGNVQNVWMLASGIFASHAEGTVFLLTNNTVSSNAGGHTWKMIERPQLMKNKNIDMIVEVDFYNPDKVNSITFPNGIRDAFKNYTFQIPMSILDKNVSENSFITINKLLDKEYIKAAKEAFSKPFKLEYTRIGIHYRPVDKMTGDVKNSNEKIGVIDIHKLIKKSLDNVYRKFSKDNHILNKVSQLLKSNMHTDYENYWNGLLAKLQKKSYNNKIMPNKERINFCKLQDENIKGKLCKKCSPAKYDDKKQPTARRTKIR